MTQHSVLIENVGKKFGLSLRSALKYGLVDSFRRAVGKGKDTTLRKGEFWALQDVNVSLEPGDALGIMGVNGSGKTTLLRILNGTYSPDAGRVTLRGRVGALIAAGAGFSPMLSGRENVFISGTLLGMTPAEIRKKFDEIVAFADLENFIDMPVRNYSSGMSVRLGFAVAVLGTPEILLVDEVLAVGDIAFQKKCYERIFTLRREGTTILFVSHAVGVMWAVCNKGLFLHHGIASGIVTPEELGKLYGQANYRAMQDTIQAKSSKDIPQEYGNMHGGTGEAFVTQFDICNEYDINVKEFAFQENLVFKMHITVFQKIHNAMFRYSIDAVHYKYIFDTDSSYSKGIGLIDIEPGNYIVKTVIRGQSLRPGTYAINAAILKKALGVHVYFQSSIGNFIIRHPEDRFMVDTVDSPAVVYFDSEYYMEKL